MTYKEAKKVIAIKNDLGNDLLTGHKSGYFEEAAELYKKSFSKEEYKVIRQKALRRLKRFVNKEFLKAHEMLNNNRTDQDKILIGNFLTTFEMDFKRKLMEL